MDIRQGTRKKRLDAIESGVNNAVDTVFEGNMDRDKAYSMLKEFCSDGLNCAKLEDSVSREELNWAQLRFPI